MTSIKNTSELAMLEAYKPLAGSYPTVDKFFQREVFVRATTPSPLSKLIAAENHHPMTTQAQDHPLFPVLVAAIEQATTGKGERHGGAVTPFQDQPWVHYAKLHGRGFLTGQAAKKLEEAASKRNGEAFEQEVLGAIVYAAMAILFERGFK